MGYNMHVRTKNRIEYGRGLFSADTSNEVILIFRLYFGNDVYDKVSERAPAFRRGKKAN